MVTLDLVPRGRGLSDLVSGEASEEILLAGCWIKLAAWSVGGDHRAFGDKQRVPQPVPSSVRHGERYGLWTQLRAHRLGLRSLLRAFSEFIYQNRWRFVIGSG